MRSPSNKQVKLRVRELSSPSPNLNPAPPNLKLEPGPSRCPDEDDGRAAAGAGPGPIPLPARTKAARRVPGVQGRCLVHCVAGANRSPTVVIAFLIHSQGWDLQQASPHPYLTPPHSYLTPPHPYRGIRLANF